VFFLVLIVIVVIALLDASGSLGYVQGALFWGTGLHLLVALRRTYRQGWIKTFFKGIGVLLAYSILISVAMVLYTLLTIVLL